jgi:hypothetical protein
MVFISELCILHTIPTQFSLDCFTYYSPALLVIRGQEFLPHNHVVPALE